jgi:hypothetical protein
MHLLLLHHEYNRKEFHLNVLLRIFLKKRYDLSGPDMAISEKHNIWSWPIYIGLQIWETFARYATFPNLYHPEFRSP